MVGITFILMSVLSTIHFTYIHYKSFYPEGSPLFYLLCGTGALLALLFCIGGVKSEKKLPKFIFLFAPYAMLYSFTYNFIVSAALFVLTMLITALLPKKRRYLKIEFDENNNISHSVRRVKMRFCELYDRRAYIFSAVYCLLFLLSCIFSSPALIWQARLFPNDFTSKETLSGNVLSSGKVTGTAWYDTNSVYVVDFFDIETEDGTVSSPSLTAGLRRGDIITHIDSVFAAKSDLITVGATENPVSIDVLRTKKDGKTENLTFTVTPRYSVSDGKYLIGMSYYNSAPVATSIQTISFIYPKTGYFAATAHSSDGLYDNNSAITGVLLNASAIGRDDDGLTVSPSNEVIGSILSSNGYGAYGICAANGTAEMPIAEKREIRYGKATLLSDFEGGSITEYDVFVTGTYRIDSRDVICFTVTDERIKKAGGITKGMSGSPLIQNGKIIGALSNMDHGGISAYATYAHDMAHELYLAAQNFDESKEG